MEKQYLDNAYKNVMLEEKEVFSLTLPIIILYRYLYSNHETILQQECNLIHSEIDVLISLLFNGKMMSPTSLYEATIFSSGGMTKVLKKLENKKLISRIISKEDKRSKLVKIEPKGEKIVQKCLEHLIDSDNKFFAILDKTEQKTLKKILKKLVYSLKIK